MLSCYEWRSFSRGSKKSFGGGEKSMTDFTAVIVLVSSTTAFAKVKFGKRQVEVESYNTVFY